jgi:hypothetical protein
MEVAQTPRGDDEPESNTYEGSSGTADGVPREKGTVCIIPGVTTLPTKPIHSNKDWVQSLSINSSFGSEWRSFIESRTHELRIGVHKGSTSLLSSECLGETNITT